MWSDAESKVDFLNFSEKAESVADIVLTPAMLPVSIGIFGDWGAGKSTILTLTESAIRKANKDSIHIKFDAWLYQGYDDARASFLETISDHLLKEVKANEGLLRKAKSLSQRVHKIRLLGIAADIGAGFMGLPTFGAFGRLAGAAESAIDSSDSSTIEITQESKKDISEAARQTSALLDPQIKKSPPQVISEFRNEYAELIREIGKPIVVYVDNLDRCTPINAINTLEAMRLFVFLPNTAFVVAADEEMIRTAVREYHKGANERHQTDYLDKLIHVPVTVPKPGILEVRAYLFMLFASELNVGDQNANMLRTSLEASLRNSWKESPISVNELLESLVTIDSRIRQELEDSLFSAERMAPILATSPRINGNPRIVKRLLNVVKMRKKVSDRRGMNLDESLITKLVIFERCVGKQATVDLYRMIDKEMGKPNIFEDIEEHDFDSEKIPESWRNAIEFVKDWAKLEPKLAGIDLRAAAYLSRDVIPMGHISSTLSSSGDALIQGLLKTKAKAGSQAVRRLMTQTPNEDYLPVMEALIDHLRKVSDWDKSPSGLTGAQLLAEENSECRLLLNKFLSGLPNKKPWLKLVIKELDQ
jgi:predicted KAP-like P-loop ATPase